MAIASISPRILLLGGGYTLSRVAQVLEPGSFVMSSRNISTVERFRESGWKAECIDITDPATLDTCIGRYPSIDIVVDSVPPAKDEAPDRYIKGIIPVLKRANVSKIIYLSTTGVFGVRDGSWVDEDSEVNPWSPPGKARLNCENAYKNSGINSVCLRLPAIVGPGRSTVDSLRTGRYRLVGDGSKWTNRIHVEDLAQVIAIITERSDVRDTYCVADNEPIQAITLASLLCEHFSIRFPLSISEEELLTQGAHTMLSNQRVSNRRLREELGVELKYPSFRWMLD